MLFTWLNEKACIKWLNYASITTLSFPKRVRQEYIIYRISCYFICSQYMCVPKPLFWMPHYFWSIWIALFFQTVTQTHTSRYNLSQLVSTWLLLPDLSPTAYRWKLISISPTSANMIFLGQSPSVLTVFDKLMHCHL